MEKQTKDSNEQIPKGGIKNYKNQVNVKLSKETNTAPITDWKEMEIYKLSDKEFRIILLKKLSELKEHTGN